MADYQDVQGAPNRGGDYYTTLGQGEQAGWWGGKAPQFNKNPNYDPSRPDDPNNPYWSVSPSGRQEDVDRYRQMGQDASMRGAYHPSYKAADQSFGAAERGFQYGQRGVQRASELQESAARGEQPSRAEILGGKMIDDSIAAQQSVAASSAGGPLAQAAASQRAANAGAAFRQGGARDISALRADEMARARDSFAHTNLGYGQNQLGYMQAGTQYNLGKTQQELQNEQFQRQLNQQGRLAYEGMAYGTNQAQLNAGMGMAGQAQRGYEFEKSYQQGEDALANQRMQTAVGAFGIPGQYIRSDMRAKAPASMPTVGGARQPPAWLQAAQEKYAAKEAAMDRAQRGYEGDIIRKNPYDNDRELEAMLDERQGQTMGDRKDTPDWLEKNVGRDVERDNPYDVIEIDEEPPGPRGVAGAPKGYAASRAKAPGYMFGSGTPEESEDPDVRYSDKRAKLSYSDPRTKEGRKALDVVEKHAGSDTAEAVRQKALAESSGGEPVRIAERNTPKTFERDTPQAQAQKGATYRKGMMDEADQQIAGMQRSLAAGPAVGTRNTPPTWLANYMGQEQGRPGVMELDDRPDTIELDEPQRVAQGNLRPEEYRHAQGNLRPEEYRHAQGAFAYSDKEAKNKAYKEGAKDGAQEAAGLFERARNAMNRGIDSAATTAARVISPPPVAAPAPPPMHMGSNQESPLVRPGYAGAPSPLAPPPGPMPKPENGPVAADMYSDKQTKNVTMGKEAPDAVLEDAARRMEGSAYSYKGEYLPPEQSPGELNYGPMTQNLEKNPVTATVVKKDGEGMGAMDLSKLAKVQSAEIAHLQKQVDGLKKRARRL